MLQKSNTHWCHHSQGERGSWWQHTWQLAELLTARKLFGTERPDVFINLVHTKPLLQQSFENHFYFFFPNYDTPECGKTEMQNKKRVFDLKWEYIYIYLFACIYKHMFCICRQTHWIIYTWSCQLQLQNPDSQPKTEWCSCHRTQGKCPKRGQFTQKVSTTPLAAHMGTEVLKNLESKIWGKNEKHINWQCKFKPTGNEENSKLVTPVLSNGVSGIDCKGIEMGRW